MPSIQSLTMTYDALNEYETFSEGDTLAGTVTLALLKETTVESLFVKAKGEATVRWTQKRGDRNHTYSAEKRYFKLKQFLIPEESKDTVLPAGTHVYKFSFNIPPGSMPSSFRGSHGKIVYMLEVKLARSWRIDRTVEKEIKFVSKSIPALQSLMVPQVGSKNKEIGIFSKGNVHMEVSIDRGAYAPGDTIGIVAKINNSSSSEMKPKFCLIQEVVYRASSNTKHEDCVIHKVVDKSIQPQTQNDVKCAMKIPSDLNQSIQNCHIISVDHYLKVYLDISFAFDPEVRFPVTIIPPGLVPGPQPDAPGGPSNSDFHPPMVAMGPSPWGATVGPSYSNFPPPNLAMGPYPASPHSSNYGHPGPQNYSAPPPEYLAQPAHVGVGYNNPVPYQASPYGSPFSSPSSTLHPPPASHTCHPPPSAPEISSSPPAFDIYPTAPAYNLLPSAPATNTDFLSQSDEAPPAYSLLFPPSFEKSGGSNT